MELEQLRQLTAVRDHGTISAAAEALHISQPALSRSLRRLEADLGQELFERTHNRARFNEAGELALTHADAVLAEVRRMREDFDELARRQRTLKVASVAPAPVWKLSALALERDPTTILDPQMTDARAAERALLNREATFAVTTSPVQPPNVVSRPLMTEDLYLSVPLTNPLATQPVVSFAQMDGQPFIVFEQVGSWMDVVRRDLPHSEVIVQRDRTVFMQLVGATELLGFTTDAPENAGIPEGRARIPIADADAHATFFLSVMADAPREVRALFDWVCEQAAGEE